MQDFVYPLALIASGAVGTVGVFAFLKHVYQLSDSEALQRAANLGLELVRFYGIEMPKMRADGKIDSREAYQFGLQLLGLILGHLRDPKAPKNLKKPHAELAGVEPFELGTRLIQMAVGGKKNG